MQILAGHLFKLGVRDAAEREDIMHDTYVLALKNLKSIRDERAALAWLLTIGRRQWAQHVRRQCDGRRLQAIDLEPARIENPEAKIYAKSVTDVVMSELAKIKDPTKKRSLQMFFLQEYSHREISKTTKIRVSTLTTWTSRFRNSVKEGVERMECRPRVSIDKAKFLQRRQVK